MLKPRDRRLLLHSLRPPAGYRLDRAIGTTFTLDLISLLTAPLAFTFFDWEDQDGRPTADPLALFEAIRRHTDRIHLFCHAGGIKVPPRGQPLLAYLEGPIIEAQPRHPEGLFHPKVWLLRYEPVEGLETEPFRYRFLCLSRNLTFDTSWDTALVLDGELRDRKTAFSRNHPLGDFIAALPGFAVRPLDKELADVIDTMQYEVRRVDFEPPEGFEDLSFWPLGLPEGKNIFPIPENNRPLLVVSPFLSPHLLEELAADREACTLVSRPESLELLPANVRDSWHTHVLAPEADPEEDESLEAAPASAPSSEDPAAENAPADTAPAETVPTEPPSELTESFAGLHAKLYVLDDGRHASVFTGSANATEAAFERNVEILVELRGKRSLCGIDALLGRKNKDKEASLADLLQPWRRSERDLAETKTRRQLELRAESIKRRIAAMGLEIHVQASRPEDGEPDTFDLQVVRTEPLHKLPVGSDNLEIRCWPASLPLETAAARPTFDSEPVARFEALSFEALTSFLAFDLRMSRDDVVLEHRFALNLPLIGAPADRKRRVLRSLLKSPEHVLRLLWLLLSHEEITAQQLVDATSSGNGRDPYRGGLDGFPLLEGLLRSLHRSPATLREVENLIADLEQTEEGRALLPEGLHDIWQPVLETWKERST